jgi:hypothetical protein
MTTAFRTDLRTLEYIDNNHNPLVVCYNYKWFRLNVGWQIEEKLELDKSAETEVFVASVSSNNQSWSRDNSNFVNSSNPWANRGGNYNNTYNAGLFNSNNNTGDANSNIGFRAGTHFDEYSSRLLMGTKNSKGAPESKSFHGFTMIEIFRPASASRFESPTLPNATRGPPFCLYKNII